jgi:hypothetical protein
MRPSTLWGSLVVAAVAAGWLAGSANGDEVAPPKRAAEVPPATKKFVVKMDPSLKVSKLILPAGLAGAQPGAKPAANKGAFWSPTRTMLAGLCLSLAVASLIFVRSTSGSARMLLIAVTGLSALGLGAAAWANAPPPGGTTARDLELDFSAKVAEGQVQIETGPADGPITLIIAGSAIAPPPKLPGGGNAPPGAGPPNPPVQPKPAK